MDQGSLLFSRRNDDVSDDALHRCPSLKHALRLCIEVTGLPLKEIAFRLDMPDKTLSRTLVENSEDHRNFPPELIPLLMDVCENEIPLRWLSLARGYGLFRLKSEVEIENERLKAELAAQEAKLATITEFLKTVNGG